MTLFRDWLVRLALVASLLLPAYFAIAALGVRFGFWGVALGFGTLTLKTGPIVVFAVLGLGALAVLLTLLVAPRRGTLVALVALLVPAAMVAGLMQFRSQAQAVPPIHDISSDLADPPMFSADVVKQRTAQGANSLDLLTKRVPNSGGRFGAAEGQLSVDLQRGAYGDILPISLSVAPPAAHQLALEAARSLGWTVTRADAETGMIEAQVQSFWFGFIDDIVIRTRRGGQAGESVVDIRSVSRIGISDVGVNAKRVRTFTQIMIQRAGGNARHAEAEKPPTPCCAAAPDPVAGPVTQ